MLPPMERFVGSVRRSRNLSAGAEPQKLDGLVYSGFPEVNIGVRRQVVGTQHVRLAGILHAQLRAVKRKALALNLAPDFFMTGEVREGFRR